jgi:hypothetical protein
MKTKKQPEELAEKPSAPLEGSRRTTKGPEPERLKISGFRNWEDAAAKLVRAKKPPGGWPK